MDNNQNSNRGYTENAVRMKNHIIQNEGSKPTFSKGTYKTYLRSSSREKIVKNSSH